MEKSIIIFNVIAGNLFDLNITELQYFVPDDPKMNGIIQTADVELTKKYITRKVLHDLTKSMFNARKHALNITGYARESHLKAIDRLTAALHTLSSISDHYSFLSYYKDVVLPEMYELTPGSQSPFKNYTPRLNRLREYVQNEVQIFKKYAEKAPKKAFCN